MNSTFTRLVRQWQVDLYLFQKGSFQAKHVIILFILLKWHTQKKPRCQLSSVTDRLLLEITLKINFDDLLSSLVKQIEQHIRIIKNKVLVIGNNY